MNTAFRKSFERDLKDLKKDHEMRRRIRKKIEEEVEVASGLVELPSLKKLTGGEKYIGSAWGIIESASSLWDYENVRRMLQGFREAESDGFPLRP